MTKKNILITAIIVFAAVLPAQQINVKFGYIMPFQSSDLWEDNLNNLAYEKTDFNSLNFSIEYQHRFQRNLSFYIEGVRYKKTVNSEYREYEYDDGSPIYQSMHLDMTSLEMGIQLNLLAPRSGFSPYIGAGVGFYFWKYEQYGDFIDFSEFDVYEGFADQEAVALGFHVKGGLSMRINRSFGLLLEAKAHIAQGDLGEYFEGFEPFDLGALSLSAGFQFYF